MKYLKKKPRAGAEWKKKREPEPSKKKTRSRSRLKKTGAGAEKKICRLPSPDL